MRSGRELLDVARNVGLAVIIDWSIRFSVTRQNLPITVTHS